MKFELKHIDDFSLKGNTLLCSAENGRIEIKFLERGMLYVSCVFNGLGTPSALEYVNSVLRGNPRATKEKIELEVTPEEGRAVCGDNVVRVERATGNIMVTNSGRTIFGGRLGTSDTVIPRIQIRGFQRNGDRSWFARINEPLTEGDRFFGMGDKSGKPDRAQKRVRIYNRDSLGYDGEKSDPLYKSIAFYIRQNPLTDTTVGFYYPEGLINAFDFGEESPFYTYVEISDGPVGFYIIPGRNYGEIVESYCTITGLPAFPPLFSFGFFGSSMNYVESDDASERILRYFKRTEDEKIPCEGMYVSSGYLKADDGKRYALYWNTRKFPAYGDYLRALRDRGYNLTMNIKPGFLTTHPWYEELKEKGYFLKDDSGNTLVEFYWGGSASFLDFANEEARNWWKEQLKDKYLSHGCTGIWNDNNECEVEDTDTDSFRRKLIFPLLMCRASWDAFRETSPGIRPWIYTRSACPGIQKYARSWTGDNTSTWKTLRYNQYQVMSLGLSGMPYIGNDLGGFYGERPSEELLVRSCQSAVFQARFVIHSWREDDRPTEPWTYPEALPMIRKLVMEHYFFMPYIYNAAYEASRTGKPMCRILALEYPEDTALATDIPVYQSGDSVIPLFTVDEGEDTLSLRLPAGTEWYDAQKKTLLSGGREYLFRVPFGEPRYLFRSPSVIPQSPGCSSLVTGRFEKLDFALVPGDEEYEYTYFEDDGEAAVEKDEYTLVRVRLTENRAVFETVHGTLPLEGRTFTASLPEGFVFADGKNTTDLVFNSGRAEVRFSGKY